MLSWKPVIEALKDFKATQFLTVPVSLLPSSQAGYRGKLLIAAFDQQPATPFIVWLHLLRPERRERKLKQSSVSVSCTLKDTINKQAKQSQHFADNNSIICTVANSSEKPHLWKKTANSRLWSAKHICIKHMCIKYTHTLPSVSILYYICKLGFIQAV